MFNYTDSVWSIKAITREKWFIHGFEGGRRTFVQRTFAQGRHDIAACQVNMPFLKLFLTSLCSRLCGQRSYKVCQAFVHGIFLLDRETLLSCKL